MALFTPRPPPQHLPPQVDRRAGKLSGCSDYVDYFESKAPPPIEPWESPLERKLRRHKEKMLAQKESLKKLIEKYDPHKDPNAVGDPFKTLFVARVSFDTTEKKLKREFEVFGSIKRVRMVYDQKGKPRGYAFIEYEHERDLKNAYKQGDGKKIDGRRVMVDVERSRTVEGWTPRRLGGGRGPGRLGKPSKKKQKKMMALETKEKEKDPSPPPRVEKVKEKEREPREPKEKVKEKEKDRERDRERDREKDREKEKGEKDRGKEKGREKEKEEREKRPAKEKGGKRERSRSRDRDRDRKKQHRDG